MAGDMTGAGDMYSRQQADRYEECRHSFVQRSTSSVNFTIVPANYILYYYCV